MEYVPGRTLKQVITDTAPLSAEDAVRYAGQALDGLAAAHSVGIVHRDIKPQNLIVRDDGTLKVADFGVARSADETVLTEHGSVIGTADYISPEQARGAPAGAASDLYSVGVMLFEMLTGSLPFTGEVPLAIANQHVRTPAPPVRQLNPAVAAPLARVVERALSKQPSRRYGSAAEMQAALTGPPAVEPAPTLIAPTVQIPAPAPTHVLPPPPPTRIMPPAPHRHGRGRRLTMRHGLAALGAVVALAGVAFVLTAGGGDGTPPLVPLPKVIGMRVATAKSALLERGFDVRVGARRHSDQPIGTVTVIRPAGATAARGAMVTLTASSGPRQVVVPSVTGLSQADATAELQRQGFVVHPGMAYDASVPAGSVNGTTPAGASPAVVHSAILLTISAGPAPVAPAPAPPAEPAPPGGPKDKHKYKHGGKHQDSQQNQQRD
jgi:serine/threonine-protein kinase